MEKGIKITPAQKEVLRLLGVPRHIGIIMDGNGRWAQEHGLPRLEGHRAGTENIRRVLEACGEYGIKIVTIYAFLPRIGSGPWKRCGA